MMGMYGRRGFTRRIVRILRPYLKYDVRNYKKYLVPAKASLKAAQYLPEENLADRQNKSPELRDFLETARRVPAAEFEVYVITGRREDERLTVEGVRLPVEEKEEEQRLLKAALGPPEEHTVNDYIRMWWD